VGYAQASAIIEIVGNSRRKQGEVGYNMAAQEPILVPLEALLRRGQEEGEFRPFDVQVMAVTIRLAIDVAPCLIAANPNLDVNSYAQELVALFDRATRRELP
jgi:hypothetical protein